MLHVILVEADDDNSVEELLLSGNYYSIPTPVEDLVGFIEASVKVSVQKPTVFDRYEVKLVSTDNGSIVVSNAEHIRV